MSHIHHDQIINTQKEVDQFFAGGPSTRSSSGTYTVHNKSYTIYTYDKTYEKGTQRFGRGCQALALTIASLGFGLFDQRVRHNWRASFTGKVTKEVAVASELVPKEIVESSMRPGTSKPTVEGQSVQPAPVTTTRKKWNNATYSLEGLPLPKGIQYAVKSATCYPYGADESDDYGWGCAWRGMQTGLSSVLGSKNVPPLSELFETYGSKGKLTTIYKEAFTKPLEPDKDADGKEKRFAPQDLDNGWAEPFIWQMVLHDKGYTSELALLYKRPDRATTPSSVFDSEKTMTTFGAFRDKLLHHFQQPDPAPVMIDDSTWTLSVIGMGTAEDESTTLWIADPHINRGIYTGKGEPVGLYTVTLKADGSQSSAALSDEHKKRLNSYSAYQALDFATKPWMVLFPGHKRDMVKLEV